MKLNKLAKTLRKCETNKLNDDTEAESDSDTDTQIIFDSDIDVSESSTDDLNEDGVTDITWGSKTRSK